MEALRRLPMELVENCGQWPAETRFGARKNGASVGIETGAIVFQHSLPEIGSSGILAFRFEGASDSVILRGQHPLPGKHNYLYGTDPKGWTTDVPTYASVEYQSLYEGIDLNVYEGGSLIEYDVICDSGHQLPSFSVLCQEADQLRIDDEGRLIARAGEWDLVQEPPVAWYVRRDGSRRPVDSRFELRGEKRFGLAVGEVLDLPLVVDPKVAFRVLAWSTHLGGSARDVAWDVAVAQYGQSMGQVFIVGETWSTDFPTTSGSYQPQKINPVPNDADVFVTRLNAQGSAYVFSTYIGTVCNEVAYAVDLADDGNGDDTVPVLTGYFTGDAPGAGNTCAYPTTTAAFDVNANKGANQNDAFVTVLDSSGASLIYSSYLGGDAGDEGRAIAVVPNPTTDGIEVVVGGWTGGGSTIAYPTMGGIGGGTPFQQSFQGPSPAGVDAFLAHITTQPVTIPPGGLVTTLLYSTYLGGTLGDEHVLDLKVNPDPDLTNVEVVAVGATSSTDYPSTLGAFRQAHQGGTFDGFLTRLLMAGGGTSDLQQSSYLGGSQDDYCSGVVLTGDAAAQEVTACGQTFTSETDNNPFPVSAGFDTTYNGNGDGFVTRLNKPLSALVWATYLGGSEIDEALDISVVPGTTATPVNVCGRTKSSDFPVSPTGLFPNQAFDITYNGDWDAFVTRISQSGGLGCSTYLGDDADEGGDDIAWGISPDGRDQVIVVGQTASFNFPVTQGVVQFNYGGGSSDGFVTKFRVGNPIGQ